MDSQWDFCFLPYEVEVMRWFTNLEEKKKKVDVQNWGDESIE